MKNNFIDFINIEPDSTELLVSELPKELTLNILANPYSNINLGIPDGQGFLDDLFKNIKSDNDSDLYDELQTEELLDRPKYTPNFAEKSALERGVYVARQLIKRGGFTKVLAAAIAGTMIDENKCDPHSYMSAEKNGKGAKGTSGNGYGAGIGSWTGALKQRVLSQAGYSPNTKIENLSMDLLIDLLIKDSLTGSKKYYDALRRCKTIEDASATSVLITGGVAKSKNWDTHPTQEDAKRLSDWYGASNDRRFGKSPYHWNLDIRRLNYSKLILAQL